VTENAPTVGLLRFIPLHVEKVWGGRRLEEVFGREPGFGPKGGSPASGKIGESWEISGLREQLTRVASGPFKGSDLYRLAEKHGEEIFGNRFADRCREDFPLLVKFIDASDVLSVQVHPNDEQARLKGFPNGKSEAWVVVAADEGACVYRGFRVGIGREEFKAVLDSGDVGRVEGCLRKVVCRPGDVIDLPAGTVHAIGKGLLLCEIQQSSDITYRVYDWGRLGLDGRPRPLHVEEAMEVLSFDDPGAVSGDRQAGTLAATKAPLPGGARDVFRDSYPFHLEVVSTSGETRLDTPGDRFEMICFLAGAGEIAGPSGGIWKVAAGQSAVIPAAWRGYEARVSGPDRGESEEPLLSWVRAWIVG
jgi:mannose-6-phosphate isomerase